MKIIDKTPFLDEKGELGLTQRIQGMLQFGFGWPNELAAQKAIITFFDRQLEKGYTLIRNMPLGQSGIMAPIIFWVPQEFMSLTSRICAGDMRCGATRGMWNPGTSTNPPPSI